MGIEQSKELYGDERCARGTPWAGCALGTLALCTQPPASFSGFWEPVLKGASGQSPSAGLVGWLTLYILRRHRAVEPGRHGSPLCFPSLHPPTSIQAAPSPRAFCVPRIILTECTPSPPSPPEARPEEASPRTTPTPRPRTLAGSGRGCDGARALPEVMAKASQPRGHLVPEKEGTALKRRGIESCRPAEGGAGAPCPWRSAPDETQEPSNADTQLEKTPKDTRQDAQACSGGPRGQPAAGLGCTVRGATTQRMDSLEETLRELEATLSQMGTALAAAPPGSPPLLPPGPQSGGGSVPPMKVVTPGASRLKAVQGQAGSPDKGKHGKQRAEYMRIQAQQQATKPSKEMSGSNETSSPVSEKPSASRTSIPVLTSFGARNSSISF